MGEVVPIVEDAEAEDVFTFQGHELETRQRCVAEIEPLPLPLCGFDAEKEGQGEGVGAAMRHDGDPVVVGFGIPYLGIGIVWSNPGFVEQRLHDGADPVVKQWEGLAVRQSNLREILYNGGANSRHCFDGGRGFSGSPPWRNEDLVGPHVILAEERRSQFGLTTSAVS